MGRVKGGKSWYERHKKDVYRIKASQSGLRSRSTFKLQQIQSKFKLFSKMDIVVELGVAPGGWSAYLVDQVRCVVGCDLLPIEPVQGLSFVQGDFTDVSIQKKLIDLAGGPPNIICSDMAPNITGIAIRDEAQVISLNQSVIDFTLEYLAKNGHVIIKLFESQGVHALIRGLQKDFTKVIRFKPDASRAVSKEFYLIAIKKN